MQNNHKENIIELLIQDIVYWYSYYEDNRSVQPAIEQARKTMERFDFQDDIGMDWVSAEIEWRKLAEKIFISCKF